MVVIIDVVDWTTKFTTLHIKLEIYSNVPPLSDVPKVTINLPCSTGPSSSETAHRMTELENSLRDQLAQSKQRHQEAIAALHAHHKEEIAEMRAESDARHAQQMAESKQQMDECLAGVKAMLQGFHEFPSITQAMHVL